VDFVSEEAVNAFDEGQEGVNEKKTPEKI